MIKEINLDNYSLIDTKSASSKGNQQKWLVNDLWYKADHMGYEGLCEVVVSELLKKSNITDFAEYFPIKIEFAGRKLNGCYSKNFRKKNESIVTLELDAFFLNEDRHTNNIAFILNDDTGEYRFCPYFDFGLSLLADTTEDYPLGEDIYNLIPKIHAKPFDVDFDVQLDAAQELYGEQVKFSFMSSDIEKSFEKVSGYYPDEVVLRVKNLIYNQKHKYGNMFE